MIRVLTVLAACLALHGGTSDSRGATASRSSLNQSLESIIRSSPDLGRASLGIRVVEADTGRVLYERGSTLPLKPASNMKVLTSAAALSLLRPEYVFVTTFSSAVGPADGVIRGDLFVKGRGSPRLVGEQWWLMAREIRARGITRIEGDLVGDDSYFDERDRPEGWPPASEDAFYNAPISALAADFGAVTVVVRPTRAGSPPDVELVPYSSFFDVVNRASTRGTRSNLRVGRQFDGERNLIIVDGNIAVGARPSLSYRSVEQPTLYALSAFREAAAKEGITIAGSDRRGIAPSNGVTIYEHESPPLAELIGTINKLSNNYMAESLLKTLGAETAAPPGTTAKGAGAVISFLADLGVDTGPLVIADGSGLSHDNRITAAAIATVLTRMYGDFESSAEFVASLAIGGVDGTLDRRMVGAPAQRNIRAKTGHLNGVSSLSGYAYTHQSRTLAFSILVNGGRGVDMGRVRQGIDRLCSAMVEADLPLDTGQTAASSVSGSAGN